MTLAEVVRLAPDVVDWDDDRLAYCAALRRHVMASGLASSAEAYFRRDVLVVRAWDLDGRPARARELDLGGLA